MKYGIQFAYWESTFDVKDFRKHIEKASKLGFDLLEISALPLLRCSDAELAELRKYADANGVSLVGGHGTDATQCLHAPDAATAQHAVQFFEDVLTRMSKAGVSSIGGGMNSYWPPDYSKPVDKAGDWARSVQGVRKVGHMAHELGVLFCVECLNRFEGYLTNTAEEGVRFVEEVDSPGVRLLLDTFHMNIEEDSFGSAIRHAAKYLQRLHCGEGNRGVPGKGHIPWQEVGAALRDIGYQNEVVMEPYLKPEGEVGQLIRVWRDLSRGADEAQMDELAKGACQFLRQAFEPIG